MTGGPSGASAEISTPLATYRLQLHAGFTFREAARLVPYLHELGVSHVYCSPYLKARPGSTHGYDVVDHQALNPEIGDADAFQAFVDALHRHGMGQILDFVPNHMGIAGGENAWWWDVLEYGRESPFAGFFDIDWEVPEPELRGKLLLPWLGEPYPEILERGELELSFDREAGRFEVGYHEHRFPLTPGSYPQILESAAATTAYPGLRELIDSFRGSGAPGEPSRPTRERAEAAKGELARLARSVSTLGDALNARLVALGGPGASCHGVEALRRLLEAQHYRLAYWRDGAAKINYRRFFDVNELAALQMERADLFETTHRLVFRWIEEGKLDGLRIDHVDGLRDPRDYCARLRASFPDRRPYLVVEKILDSYERLRPDWPVDGTSGYDFLNLVNGLFVNPRGEAALERAYRSFAGERLAFEEILRGCKEHVLGALFPGELGRLAHRLHSLARLDARVAAFDLVAVRGCLKQLLVAFPVYRTYVSERGVDAADRREIERAVDLARERVTAFQQPLLRWLREVLTLDLPEDADPRLPPGALEFAMRLQQFTGALMAKALEDTSFYRDGRLVSLNEVGGDPRRFGVSVETFHRASHERAQRWPRAMLATATHDTKRGEDVRARIDVLSEIPDEWQSRVRGWAHRNRRFKRVGPEGPAPSAGDEYLLYQTLVGSWPFARREVTASEWIAYRERIERYMIKAVREAKERSSWRQPDREYEAALSGFVRSALDPSLASPFLEDFRAFERRTAPLGASNGLAQLVLKLTAPGVPVVYQGCELWDLNLVDPDNRRPVDYERRQRWLRELSARPATPELVRSLVEDWPDGRLKLWTTAQLLRFRRAHPQLFLQGSYVPLAMRGERREHACAFARVRGDDVLIVAVARRVAELPRGEIPFPIGEESWPQTTLVAPDGIPMEDTYDVVTGRSSPTATRAGAVEIPAAELFADLPVAVRAMGRGRLGRM